jgi:hypothetical protein
MNYAVFNIEDLVKRVRKPYDSDKIPEDYSSKIRDMISSMLKYKHSQRATCELLLKSERIF